MGTFGRERKAVLLPGGLDLLKPGGHRRSRSGVKARKEGGPGVTIRFPRIWRGDCGRLRALPNPSRQDGSPKAFDGPLVVQILLLLKAIRVVDSP